MKIERIVELLDLFQPISLDQMVSVRLMNRTDTKFLTTPEQLYTLLKMMGDRYYIQEIEGNRLSGYQTTYLDTDNLDMYLAHQNGHAPREKIRVRTYMDTSVTFLEIKDKNNKGRTLKDRVRLSAIGDIESESIAHFIREKSMFHSKEISPCLESRFRRITFVNKEMTERLTIDLRLHFFNLRTGRNYKMDNLVIIELKQDGNVISPTKDLLTSMQIRPLGISKYCLGSILTTPSLKYNRFKTKLIKINKLTQQQHG